MLHLCQNPVLTLSVFFHVQMCQCSHGSEERVPYVKHYGENLNCDHDDSSTLSTAVPWLIFMVNLRLPTSPKRFWIYGASCHIDGSYMILSDACVHKHCHCKNKKIYTDGTTYFCCHGHWNIHQFIRIGYQQNNVTNVDEMLVKRPDTQSKLATYDRIDYASIIILKS